MMIKMKGISLNILCLALFLFAPETQSVRRVSNNRRQDIVWDDFINLELVIRNPRAQDPSGIDAVDLDAEVAPLRASDPKDLGGEDQDDDINRLATIKLVEDADLGDEEEPADRAKDLEILLNSIDSPRFEDQDRPCVSSFSLTSFIQDGLVSPDSNCSYIIEKPVESVCRLSITFNNFSSENDCSKAALVIDGEKFCGNMSGITEVLDFDAEMALIIVNNFDPNDSLFYNITVRQIQCLDQAAASLEDEVFHDSAEDLIGMRQEVPSCDRLFSSSEFILQSPGYPNFYPNNVDCVFTVIPANDNICSLELRFDEFRVEPSPTLDQCEYDYLEVSDDNPLTNTMRYCGFSTGIRLLEMGNLKRFRFHSNNNVTDVGFSIFVTQISCEFPNNSSSTSRPEFYTSTTTSPTPISTNRPTFFPTSTPSLPPFVTTTPAGPSLCSATYYASKPVKLTSPNYPGPYFNNEYCLYNIYFTRNDICYLQVNFVNFDLEASPECEKDFVVVNDNQRLCGRKAGIELFPVDNFKSSADIIFSTDLTGRGPGFELLISQVQCDNFPSTTRVPTTVPPLPTDNPFTTTNRPPFHTSSSATGRPPFHTSTQAPTYPPIATARPPFHSSTNLPIYPPLATARPPFHTSTNPPVYPPLATARPPFHTSTNPPVYPPIATARPPFHTSTNPPVYPPIATARPPFFSSPPTYPSSSSYPYFPPFPTSTAGPPFVSTFYPTNPQPPSYPSSPRPPFHSTSRPNFHSTTPSYHTNRPNYITSTPRPIYFPSHATSQPSYHTSRPPYISTGFPSHSPSTARPPFHSSTEHYAPSYNNNNHNKPSYHEPRPSYHQPKAPSYHPQPRRPKLLTRIFDAKRRFLKKILSVFRKPKALFGHKRPSNGHHNPSTYGPPSYKGHQQQSYGISDGYGTSLAHVIAKKDVLGQESELDFSPSPQMVECGSTSGATEFYLKSPNYPDNYGHNSDCSYSILARPGMCALQLFMEDFIVEESSGCHDDYLAANGIQICSQQSGKEVLLPLTEELEWNLQFHSDSRGSTRGFMIRGKQISCDEQFEIRNQNPVTPPTKLSPVTLEPCDPKHLEESVGIIIPRPVGSPRICAYRIKPALGSCKVNFYLKGLALEGACEGAFVEINDVPFCISEHVTSLHDIKHDESGILIRLIGNHQDSKIQWKIDYEQVQCDEIEENQP